MYKNSLFSIIKPGVNQFETKLYLATSEIDGLSIKEGWYVNYNTRESRANMQPSYNSVWFAKMKNSVKHIFLNKNMKHYVDNSILSTGFYGLQCNEVSFEYVASLINNKNFEIQKDRFSHGATQQGITDEDLKNIIIKVPSNEILKKYHDETKSLFNLFAKNIEENRNLIKLRDFLLPLLMNGQATIE